MKEIIFQIEPTGGIFFFKASLNSFVLYNCVQFSPHLPSVISICVLLPSLRGFPGGSGVKNPLANVGAARDSSSIPGAGRFPGGGHGNHPLHILARIIPWARSLAGYDPWGLKESDTVQQLSMRTPTFSEIPKFCGRQKMGLIQKILLHNAFQGALYIEGAW